MHKRDKTDLYKDLEVLKEVDENSKELFELWEECKPFIYSCLYKNNALERNFIEKISKAFLKDHKSIQSFIEKSKPVAGSEINDFIKKIKFPILIQDQVLARLLEDEKYTKSKEFTKYIDEDISSILKTLEEENFQTRKMALIKRFEEFQEKRYKDNEKFKKGVGQYQSPKEEVEEKKVKNLFKTFENGEVEKEVGLKKPGRGVPQPIKKELPKKIVQYKQLSSSSSEEKAVLFGYNDKELKEEIKRRKQTTKNLETTGNFKKDR